MRSYLTSSVQSQVLIQDVRMHTMRRFRFPDMRAKALVCIILYLSCVAQKGKPLLFSRLLSCLLPFLPKLRHSSFCIPNQNVLELRYHTICCASQQSAVMPFSLSLCSLAFLHTDR
ncbi:unnamed protein product, partial [Ectocarpus sp. 8 AP-2014]